MQLVTVLVALLASASAFAPAKSNVRMVNRALVSRNDKISYNTWSDRSFSRLKLWSTWYQIYFDLILFSIPRYYSLSAFLSEQHSHYHPGHEVGVTSQGSCSIRRHDAIPCSPCHLCRRGYWQSMLHTFSLIVFMSSQAFGIDDPRLLIAAHLPLVILLPLYLNWAGQQEGDDFFDGYEKRRNG